MSFIWNVDLICDPLNVDLKLETCENHHSVSGPGFEVKLYNSAEDKSNFTVKTHIENFYCNMSRFYVYGDQQETTNSQLNPNDFIGSFTELSLVDERNADNICEYKSLVNTFWPYVYIKIFNKEGDAKICEVEFN